MASTLTTQLLFLQIHTLQRMLCYIRGEPVRRNENCFIEFLSTKEKANKSSCQESADAILLLMGKVSYSDQTSSVTKEV